MHGLISAIKWSGMLILHFRPDTEQTPRPSSEPPKPEQGSSEAPLHRLSFLLPLYLGFGQLYELASNNPWRWHVEKTRLPKPERCFHAMLTSIPTHDLAPMPPSAPSKQTKRSRPFIKTFHRHLSAVSGGINCAARGNGGIAPAVAPTSIYLLFPHFPGS
jgi:hypothetical protein